MALRSLQVEPVSHRADAARHHHRRRRGGRHARPRRRQQARSALPHRSMGTDLLVVRRGRASVRVREESASLTPRMRRRSPSCPSRARGAGECVVGDSTLRRHRLRTTGIGTSDGYAPARNWPSNARRVLLGRRTSRVRAGRGAGPDRRRQPFHPEADPIGQYVLINNIPFQVVGVLAPKGASRSGGDIDDNVFMPLTTAEMRLFGRRLRTQHHGSGRRSEGNGPPPSGHPALLLDRHGRVDFQIRNMASLLETASETQDTLTLLLGSIAAISLLVGGIGVMNIMLVSVTERVREIGSAWRPAARMANILLQFLTEALVVRARRSDRRGGRARPRPGSPNGWVTGGIFVVAGAARVRQCLRHRHAVRLSAGAPRCTARPRPGFGDGVSDMHKYLPALIAVGLSGCADLTTKPYERPPLAAPLPGSGKRRRPRPTGPSRSGGKPSEAPSWRLSSGTPRPTTTICGRRPCASPRRAPIRASWRLRCGPTSLRPSMPRATRHRPEPAARASP